MHIFYFKTVDHITITCTINYLLYNHFKVKSCENTLPDFPRYSLYNAEICNAMHITFT